MYFIGKFIFSSESQEKRKANECYRMSVTLGCFELHGCIYLYLYRYMEMVWVTLKTTATNELSSFYYTNEYTCLHIDITYMYMTT